VPVLSTADLEQGTVTRRSDDSIVASLLLPPDDAPQLTLQSVGDWGPALDGVAIRVLTDAPVEPSTLGAFTLAVDAKLGDGTPLSSFSSALADIVVASTTSAPNGADAGAFTRSVRAGRQTTVAAWFTRPAISDEVHVTVTLSDPLRRRRTLDVVVPAGTTSSPPTVRITDVRRSGTATVVLFGTDAPDVVGPDGPCVLRISARRFMGLGPSSSLQVNLPDVLDASAIGPNPPGRIVVAKQQSAGRTEYAALIRLARPFQVIVAVTDPQGRTGTARQMVGLVP
jgi:hypothetical protein